MEGAVVTPAEAEVEGFLVGVEAAVDQRPRHKKNLITYEYNNYGKTF